jgi:hypothetical protein
MRESKFAECVKTIYANFSVDEFSEQRSSLIHAAIAAPPRRMHRID